MEKGIIYCVLFPNEKRYIGQTVCFLSRKRQHYSRMRLGAQIKFYNALRKYQNQEQWFVLEENIKIENLNDREIYYIKFWNSFNDGYNSTIGGNVCPLSEEQKQKISEKLMGHPVSEETRKKISEKCRGKPAFFKGKTLSEDHKRKVSIATKKAMSKPEIREKVMKSIEKSRVSLQDFKNRIYNLYGNAIVVDDNTFVGYKFKCKFFDNFLEKQLCTTASYLLSKHSKYYKYYRIQNIPSKNK